MNALWDKLGHGRAAYPRRLRAVYAAIELLYQETGRANYGDLLDVFSDPINRLGTKPSKSVLKTILDDLQTRGWITMQPHQRGTIQPTGKAVLLRIDGKLNLYEVIDP